MLYCATCKKQILNESDLRKHNLKHVITIASVIRILDKDELNHPVIPMIIPPTKSDYYKKYILYRRKQAIHFGVGAAECGIKQSSTHLPIQTTINMHEVTCYRCKKTYRFKEASIKREVEVVPTK